MATQATINILKAKQQAFEEKAIHDAFPIYQLRSVLRKQPTIGGHK